MAPSGKHPTNMASQVVAALACATLLVGTAAGCGDDDEAAVDDPIEATEEDVAVIETESRDVFTQAEDLVGEQVSGVVGEVSELVGPDGLLLASLENGEVLVIASATPPLEEGAIVEVAGEVMTLDPDTFQDDFGLVYDEAYDQFAGRAVLRAPNVEVAEPADG